MVVIKSDIEQKSAAYFKELGDKADAAVQRAMVRTGLVGEARVKGIIQREAHDTGAFLRSVTTSILKGKDLLRLIIGSNLDYALAVEHGRKPGRWPNIDALVGWTARKLKEKGINARVNVSVDQLKIMAKEKRATGEKSRQAEVARIHLSMIYLVGRKIATKGIRQKLIFKRIEDGLLAYFRAEVQKELDLVR